MRIGNDVELQMKKPLKKGLQADDTVYACKLLAYDAKEERACLLLCNAKLTDITLDAIYECAVRDTEETRRFRGRVKERYNNPYGAVLEIKIENGFWLTNENESAILIKE